MSTKGMGFGGMEHQIDIERLQDEVADLRAQLAAAQSINEWDRWRVHDCVAALQRELRGRAWLRDGRGPYAYDDDRYQEEFGAALDALQRQVDALRDVSSSLEGCPKTSEEVQAALDAGRLRSQLAAAEQTIRQLQREEYVKAAAVVLKLGSRLHAVKKQIKKLEDAVSDLVHVIEWDAEPSDSTREVIDELYEAASQSAEKEER